MEGPWYATQADRGWPSGALPLGTHGQGDGRAVSQRCSERGCGAPAAPRPQTARLIDKSGIGNPAFVLGVSAGPELHRAPVLPSWLTDSIGSLVGELPPTA